MGCNASRLDGLPAVAMCRDRCNFLDEALRQSYAMADAHVAHMESLRTLGPALHRFFHQLESPSDDAISKSSHSHSHLQSPLHSSSSDSDSSSHMVVHSESEAEDTDTDKESQFFNQTRYDSSPPHSSDHHNVGFMNYSQPLYTAPSPPPPATSSAWDFLNLFETFDKYQLPYSPSRDTNVNDVKPKENKDKKKKESTHHHNHNHSHNHKGDHGNGEAKKKKKDAADDSKEEKNSGSQKQKQQPLEPSSAKGLSEAMKEIQIMFERASDSGNPILEMLDVGKLRYHRNIAVNPVPCKLMHVFNPSTPRAVNCMESSLVGRRTGSGNQGVDMDKDKGLTYGNLCSTLHKLCMWEKKLYDEVKAEEKLRMLHEKKCKQLRRMNKKGADAQKIDSVETIIGVLATKMKISFQVVDKISNTICELREEELWPQISSFIFRFLRMWKDMLECYRCQYKEIAEAKSLDASSFSRKLSNSHLDAAIKLKSEIQNWNLSFSDWIYAQKSHVKALNGWLVRCLMHDPEEIADGSAPFSPGRIGAPPVFVICTKWSRAMDNLSEKNVIEAVNGFILRVNELLEKHISELQQKLTLDKELERQVKILERQEQKMHKVVQARERKMGPIAREDTDALLRGDAVHHGELVGTIGLQSCLKHIFAAMERFTASIARAYEEICQQIEQDSHVSGEINNIH